MPTALRSTLALRSSRCAPRSPAIRSSHLDDVERGWLSVDERLVPPVTGGAVPTPGGAGAAAPAGDVATSGGAR